MDGKVADVCNVVALEAIPLETNDAGPSTSISSPTLPDFEKNASNDTEQRWTETVASCEC